MVKERERIFRQTPNNYKIKIANSNVTMEKE